MDATSRDATVISVRGLSAAPDTWGAIGMRMGGVVFNIKGSEYRLIVAIAYTLQVVCVKFIGTHQQYDAIDAHTIESS
jgi:mRNA interferase HigB